MTNTRNTIQAAALATIFATTTLLAAIVHAEASPSAVKLLTAKFDSREIVKIEAGDFHFLPGQNAPIHTHSAPAVGYVTKGSIIYQVEGEKPKILNKGDVFYEPVGPRILRFDNLSATEEAIFIDFNLEQVGEPFIVFEKAPTEAIDRRTLPTVDLAKISVDQVDIYETELEQNGTVFVNYDTPTLGFVAEGVVEISIKGKERQRIAAGATFAFSDAGTKAIITNGSSEVAAKIITFVLR